MRPHANMGHRTTATNQYTGRSQANNAPYRARQDQHPSQPSIGVDNATTNQNQAAETGAKKKFKSIKSHGKQYAIEVSADVTQKKWHTVRFEAAAKLNNGTKAYDWKNKIGVQLTKQELPVVIGTLLGYLPGCEYSQHGDTNKGFSIQNQHKNFYFKVFEASTNRFMNCPVPIEEAHLMGMLVLAEHTRNFEGVSSDAALTAIKNMCLQMYKHSAFPAPRANK
ncbi:hypothetical protein [Alteromonas gilva]|uniref:Uncharacterized protein n=1 Tax=Alteromonas gilva TaxID=2987522 RepID=A0ABT5L7C3_9ALTE|nr:hypothetical protein [Alteromonas gilva]MDC8832962.1 hypothetical protein [Alteromonas gilva]